MRALKILVAVMGAVLIVGIMALGLGIAYRINHPRVATSAPTRATAQLDRVPHTVMLPAGAKILGVENDGEHVMVRLGLASGGEELMLLDWRSGATLATINLK